MVSTFTGNIQLEEPARGDDVGTWDTPVNNNMTLLDAVIAQVTSISLNNSPVVLASGQYQSRTIIFNSTLTGSVTITFPTSFHKDYNIYNTCTGSSAFVVTLQTTVAGAEKVCAPPGEAVQVYTDGANIRFLNLGRVGTYVDFATSSAPAWITGCTVPPYLNCDGTAFSSATYPQLTTILGVAVLPDCRGRKAHYLNQGTGRLTTAGAGLDGNTILAIKDNNGTSLASSNIPTITATGNNTITVAPPAPSLYYPGASALFTTVSPGSGGTAAAPAFNPAGPTWTQADRMVGNNVINTTYTNASPQPVQDTSPSIVTGIRMIRAG